MLCNDLSIYLYIYIPPVQVAMGETTTCASGVFVPKVRVKGAKVRTNISTIWSGMQQQQATPITTATNQLRTSTGTVGVHNAAIIATYLRAALLKRNDVPLHKLQ